MSDAQRVVPFKVDIAGIIDIMGSSLYSRVDTPIRELLQNAHDAIARRRRLQLEFQGRIDVRLDPEARTLAVTDDGVGLSLQEAEDYLGTLGIGITGLIKRGQALPAGSTGGERSDLIGQFGVGLFSAFMLADRLIVESRREGDALGIRWEAGAGTEILLAEHPREQPGTTVTLVLKEEFAFLTRQPEMVEKAIREYADFLPIPIYFNDGPTRVNVIHVAWFEASPDDEAIELALTSYFDESPLDVIPVRLERPVSIAGALYVTPQRVPGFSDLATVMVTVRRMVISRRIQGLLPDWAPFLRGCLELHDCAPTASREDLVRNEMFALVKHALEELLYDHFERLARTAPQRLEAILQWHRYTFAGAALENRRLRNLLRSCYRLPTSRGQLTINEILEASPADPLFEEEAERVVWFNTDRRQERWVNQLFHGHAVPCVHAFRSFEESLLAAVLADDAAEGTVSDLRMASPSAPNFATGVLGVRELEEAPAVWQEFLRSVGAKILVASFQSQQPVMAFLNERYALAKSLEDLKQRGEIPSGFQRLIDTHFREAPVAENEVLLNRNHRLVQRALQQQPGTPLSSVLRLLVVNALNAAGGAIPLEARQVQTDDLDWIAECLWGRES